MRYGVLADVHGNLDTLVPFCGQLARVEDRDGAHVLVLARRRLEAWHGA
jgi:hypothetical protein